MAAAPILNFLNHLLEDANLCTELEGLLQDLLQPEWSKRLTAVQLTLKMQESQYQMQSNA